MNKKVEPDVYPEDKKNKSKCSCRKKDEKHHELSEQEVEEAVDKINPDPESMESRG